MFQTIVCHMYMNGLEIGLVEKMVLRGSRSLKMLRAINNVCSFQEHNITYVNAK